MRSISALHAWAAALLAVNPVYATESFSTVLDQLVGDDIGWSQELFVKDINQDGNADIFLLFNGRRGVHYLGNGDGTFTDGVWFTVEYSVTSHPLLEDFNNDGWPDLFKHAIFPGGGDLTYSKNIPVDSQLQQCEIMLSIDFNIDGFADIICATDNADTNSNEQSYGVLLFTNNGDFNFSLDATARNRRGDDLETSVETMVGGDLNNNGIDDIVQVVRNYAESDSGGGTRTESHTVITYLYEDISLAPTGRTFDTGLLHDTTQPWGASRIKSAQLTDTNNDGNTDLVLLGGSYWTSDSAGFIAIFHGNGDGSFNHQPTKQLLPSSRASDFKVTDLDNDGNKDLVITYANNHDLPEQLGTTVAFGAGDSTFGEAQMLPATQDNVWQSDTADINNDGRQDIVTLSGWNAGARLLAFSSDASVTPHSRPVCKYTISDSDGDGWGWEKGQSCVVTDDSSPESPDIVLLPRNPAFPLCTNSATDADDDGWGWENNATCQVGDHVELTLPEVVPNPLCERPWLDFDGDGWGYENGQSCRAVR